MSFLGALCGSLLGTVLLGALPWRAWLLRYGSRRCPQGHRMAKMVIGPNTAFKQRKCSECTYAVYT
jgi:hypothetical protein